MLCRYLRLSVPTTASIVLAWALLGLFPDKARSLDLVLPHNWPKLIQQSPLPPLLFTLVDGFFNVFKDGWSGFNVVLWTMKKELFGSLAIYLIYGLVKSRMRFAVLLLAGIGCVLISPIYFGFALGAGLREFWVTKPQPRYGAVAFFIGVLLGFPAPGFMRRIFGFENLPATLEIGGHASLFAHIAALLIVYSALYWELADRVLSTAPVQFLGRLSFPLYLVHVPILFTVITGLYLLVTPSPLMLGGLLVIFLLVSIGAAWLFELSIDLPLLTALSNLKLRSRPLRSRLDRGWGGGQ